MSCLDFVSIFLNNCLISEGWKLKIDLEYHCIMNSFIAQYFVRVLFENGPPLYFCNYKDNKK